MFRIRASVPWALCIAALFCAHPNRAEADTKIPVSDCLRVEKVDTVEGFDFTFDSECERNVLCTIEWELVCRSESDKTQHAEKKRVSVPKNAQRVVHASVAACNEDNWTLTNPSWQCSPK